jgi:hypothetical protein
MVVVQFGSYQIIKYQRVYPKVYLSPFHPTPIKSREQPIKSRQDTAEKAANVSFVDQDLDLGPEFEPSASVSVGDLGK